MAELAEQIARLSPEERAEFEAWLRERRGGVRRTNAVRPSIGKRPSTGPSPLSSAQLRQWFLDQLEPGNPVYNVPCAYRIQGELNVAALQRALTEICWRHEALRTTFVEVDGQPSQIVSTPTEVPLEQVSLEDIPPAEQARAALTMAQTAAAQPFCLCTGPLLRAVLYRSTSIDHLLLLTLHHIVTDAWSTGLLMSELSSLYNAAVAGQPSPLPDLSIQYADFACWQRDWLDTHGRGPELEYWRQHLAGVPSLELPSDHIRPPVQSYKGVEPKCSVPPPVLERLKIISRQHGCTLFMTMLAAFAILVQRYSRQDDFVVGIPMANRTTPDVEPLIGLFINTLPLRVNVLGNPTFVDLLQRIRSTSLDAFTHQDYPFERLVEELRPQRSLSRAPIFQVVFDYLNTPHAELNLVGLHTERQHLTSHLSMFDLIMYVREEGTTLELGLSGSLDLFDPATVERILAHYLRIIEAIAADPYQVVTLLPIISAAERRTMLVQWNKTESAYPRDAAIHDLFQTQAAASPDIPALVWDGSQMSYRELNTHANRLAHYLRQLGIGQDAPVPVCLERSPDAIIAILAILKAGGAYVPLDPSQPAERMADTIRQTSATTIVTNQQLSARLPDSSAAIVRLDADAARISAMPNTNPANDTSATDLAYIIFTSGSTGSPKGVAIPHRAVVRLVRNTNYIAVAPTDVFLQLAPLSFDASTFEIWASLLNGARLVLAPHHLPSLDSIGQAVANNHVSILWLTAGLFHQMVESQLASLGQLRLLLAGGDVLSPPHVQSAVLGLPNCQVINGYGPTENTTFTCCYPVPAGLDPRQPVPIGCPIANTHVYILDACRQPVPVGVPGELYIGGDGLARGYIGLPDLTAATFVPNPFSSSDAARLYRSGDLARFLPDGNIQFLGRLDRQVKVRGFRIEPDEIEAALTHCPGVRQAAVVVAGNDATDKHLVAYVVPASDSSASPAQVRTFLAAHLPEYMIPSRFVTLDALPLSSNGKVDRSALPTPGSSAPTTGQHVPPHDDVERRLLAIWQSLLNLQPISINDDFFDIGGHSLLAMRLFAHIEQAFGLALPVAALFQAPTIAQLAQIIRLNNAADAWSPVVPIQTKGTRPAVFCVHGFGGGVVGYAGLARLLGADQPFYGLQAKGLNGNEAPHSSLDEMAACYLAAIRIIQPHGPYYLAGYCYGGVVAYEMARQLSSVGESVAHLALIDAAAPNQPRQPRSWQSTWCSLSNLPYWLHDFWQRDRAGRPLTAHIHERATTAWQMAARRRGTVDMAAPMELVLTESNRPGIPDAVRMVMETQQQAISGYEPQPYHGRVTLYRVRAQSLFVASDPTNGWGRLAAGGLDVRRIAGAHYDLLDEPYVRTLADQLRRDLHEKTASATPPPVTQESGV